jgi:hypothetical protein
MGFGDERWKNMELEIRDKKYGLRDKRQELRDKR